MRAYSILAAVCLITGYSYAFADSISNSVSLALPSASGNYAQDKFRAGELDCANAISSATTMEVGLTSIIQGSTESRGRVGDIAIYSRITFPLGARPKARINCNLLFELELRKKQLELQKLRQEITRLKEMTFEN